MPRVIDYHYVVIKLLNKSLKFTKDFWQGHKYEFSNPENNKLLVEYSLV